MSHKVFLADCFEWMKKQNANSFHAIVTDPPYGIVEYSRKELRKMEKGVGGIWRIPPKIGGSKRRPLPRFTVLNEEQIEAIHDFFFEWGKLALKVLVPGAHVMIASNPYLVSEVITSLKKAGFEHRGIIVRLVRTLKGGFRPKLAENEFENVSTNPRSCWEPWALLRKPFNGRVSDNLRKWGTGGLRRNVDGTPFIDVLISERTPKTERQTAPHPTLKPQSLMRRLVWASLPLGKGIILDPFCGAGSTLAAAEALGLESVGVEINPKYYEMALDAIPKLSALNVDLWAPKNNKKNLMKKLGSWVWSNISD